MGRQDRKIERLSGVDRVPAQAIRLPDFLYAHATETRKRIEGIPLLDHVRDPSELKQRSLIIRVNSTNVMRNDAGI